MSLDDQQREFILQRERVIDAHNQICKIDWQSINLRDKELALKIRSNVLHALSVLLQSMRRNEEPMLWQSSWKPGQKPRR